MNIHRVVAANIADGTGKALYSGRITIADGYILQIEKGDFLPGKGDIFVDDSKILAPAFIDAHAHSDLSLLAMPEASGKTCQGIAYEISGNCGLSPFPLTELNREHLQKLYQCYCIKLDWNTFAEYQARLRSANAELELFAQVGHNTLRAAVAGYEKKELSATEKALMLELLDRELSAGAVGLSFGLLYTPGIFADFPEITDLMRVVAKHNKICTVHLRSESTFLEESLQEMLSAARASGLKKLHISHLKTAGVSNFHKVNSIINALNSKDLRVTGDIYCYDASMTQLSVILPEPYDGYDDVKIMELLQDKDRFAEVLKKVRLQRQQEYWQNVRLISAAEPFTKYCNRLFCEAAEAAGIPPEKLFLQIVRNDAVNARAAFHTLSQKNMELLASHDSVVPGSDESARNLTTQFGISHPRGFGNHARYFLLRRQQGADIAQTVHEMSGRIAEIFDLKNIGTIQNGSRAVFTVIDPEHVADRSTFAHAHCCAEGFEILRFKG